MASTFSGAGASVALWCLNGRHLAVFRRRLFSETAPRCSSLQPPDVPLLADAARITLSPAEVEDFAPKIRQVVDWFGQLQAVDLQSIQPSYRADTEVTAEPREDLPEIFENRDAIVAAIPSYDNPYMKVPKIINKD